MNCRHQELTTGNYVEFPNQNDLERTHEERTVTVSKLTDRPEISETGNERAVTTRQGIVRMSACCEEILNEKAGPFSRQPSMFHFFRSL